MRTISKTHGFVIFLLSLALLEYFKSTSSQLIASIKYVSKIDSDSEGHQVYLWAALAILLASWAARVFWFFRPLSIRSMPWFIGSEATLTPLPGDMTQIEVVAPTNFSWYPGQHVFLRFPKVNMFDNHPFTITSASPAATSQQQEPAKLVFLARTHTGFTKRLATYSKTSQAGLANAWVDGPYGGITVPVHGLFDNVICIAGGTGLTPCLGLLANLVSKHAASSTICCFKTVKFIWVFRELRHFAWAGERFASAAAAAQSASGLAIEFRFYVTGDNSSNLTMSAKNEKLANETETGTAVHHEYTSSQIELLGELTSGRPQLSTIVPGLLTEGKNFVLCCGPQSFRDDLSQSCAAAQAKAMRGTIKEISLHTEAFSW